MTAAHFHPHVYCNSLLQVNGFAAAEARDAAGDVAAAAVAGGGPAGEQLQSRPLPVGVAASPPMQSQLIHEPSVAAAAPRAVASDVAGARQPIAGAAPAGAAAVMPAWTGAAEGAVALNAASFAAGPTPEERRACESSRLVTTDKDAELGAPREETCLWDSFVEWDGGKCPTSASMFSPLTALCRQHIQLRASLLPFLSFSLH